MCALPTNIGIRPDEIIVYLSGTFSSLRTLELTLDYDLVPDGTHVLDLTALCASRLRSLVVSSTEVLRWNQDVLTNLTTLVLRYKKHARQTIQPETEPSLLNVLSKNRRLTILHLLDAMQFGGFRPPNRNSPVLNLPLLSQLMLGDTIPNLQQLLPRLLTPNIVTIDLRVTVQADDDVSQSLSAVCTMVETLVRNAEWIQAAFDDLECTFDDDPESLTVEAKSIKTKRKIALEINCTNLPDLFIDSLGSNENLNSFSHSLIRAMPLAQLTNVVIKTYLIEGIGDLAHFSLWQALSMLPSVASITYEACSHGSMSTVGDLLDSLVPKSLAPPSTIPYSGLQQLTLRSWQMFRTFGTGCNLTQFPRLLGTLKRRQQLGKPISVFLDERWSVSSQATRSLPASIRIGNPTYDFDYDDSDEDGDGADENDEDEEGNGDDESGGEDDEDSENSDNDDADEDDEDNEDENKDDGNGEADELD